MDEIRTSPKRGFRSSPHTLPGSTSLRKAKSLDIATRNYEEEYGFHLSGCDVKNLKLSPSVHGMMTQFPFPAKRVRYDLEWYLSQVEREKLKKSRFRRVINKTKKTIKQGRERFFEMSNEALYAIARRVSDGFIWGGQRCWRDSGRRCFKSFKFGLVR